MLPQIKPNKYPLCPDSYRPINNLPTLEKLFEAYVLEFFIEFLEENLIIDCSHHGGLKLHSPETGMAAIQQALSLNVDNNLISTILSNDLSAAYDTVDPKILLQKLKHYGVREDELSLITSILNNRLQFVLIAAQCLQLNLLAITQLSKGQK